MLPTTPSVPGSSAGPTAAPGMLSLHSLCATSATPSGPITTL